MDWRNAVFASAAALIASLSAPAQADATARSSRCEEMNFRVYFDRDSARLSPAALETLHTAQRNVQGCSYAELHVLAESGRLQSQRGRAIVAAMHGRAWNVVRVERQQFAQTAYGGPEFVEVLTTPNHVPARSPLNDQEAGV